VNVQPSQASPAALIVNPSAQLQAVLSELIVKLAEQLAHMEAPSVVQSAPVAATPLAHVHVFAKGLVTHGLSVQYIEGCIHATIVEPSQVVLQDGPTGGSRFVTTTLLIPKLSSLASWSRLVQTRTC
jgi:hypothetical protein